MSISRFARLKPFRLAILATLILFCGTASRATAGLLVDVRFQAGHCLRAIDVQVKISLGKLHHGHWRGHHSCDPCGGGCGNPCDWNSDDGPGSSCDALGVESYVSQKSARQNTTLASANSATIQNKPARSGRNGQAAIVQVGKTAKSGIKSLLGKNRKGRNNKNGKNNSQGSQNSGGDEIDDSNDSVAQSASNPPAATQVAKVEPAASKPSTGNTSPVSNSVAHVTNSVTNVVNQITSVIPSKPQGSSSPTTNTAATGSNPAVAASTNTQSQIRNDGPSGNLETTSILGPLGCHPIRNLTGEIIRDILCFDNKLHDKLCRPLRWIDVCHVIPHPCDRPLHLPGFCHWHLLDPCRWWSWFDCHPHWWHCLCHHHHDCPPPTSVPEPGSLTLIGIAMVVGAGYTARRRRTLKNLPPDDVS